MILVLIRVAAITHGAFELLSFVVLYQKDY
jgi:hypothetical protein